MVDKKIVHDLFNLNLNITKSFDEVCQDILNKRNTDYCGAYELIKHDKLKKEYFQSGGNTKQYFNNYMSGTPKQSEEDEPEKKYKKKGTLRSIAQILSNMNQARRIDSMVMLSENTHQSKSRGRDLVMSTAHLKRLNRINQKFKKYNDYNVDLNNPSYQTMSMGSSGHDNIMEFNGQKKNF